MKIAKFVLPAIAAGFMASSAMGAVSAVAPVTVDNSSGGAPLVGFITNDLTINVDSDWTAAALLTSLSSGSIYQDAFGGDVDPPSAAIIGLVPSAEWDTYVTNPGGGASAAGAAGDVGGDVQEVSTTELDISWNSPGADTDDIGVISIARITLSDDANGSLTYAITVAGDAGKTTITLPIVNGVITPEPASLALLGLGGLAVLRRR